MLFFGDNLAVRFSVSHIIPYLWVLPVVFWGKGFYQALQNWAIRQKNFRIITRTKISQGISASGVKIGLGVFGVKPLGLILGIVAQEAAGIISLLSKLIKEKPSFFKYFSWHEIIAVASRYKKFPLFQSWSQLLLALGAQLPVLLIGAYYGAGAAGIFGLAHNMINMPMTLIGQSVAQVYFGEISKYGKHNPKKIYKLSLSVMKKMFWVGLLPIGLLIALAPWLFEFVFGSEWVDAGFYARFLSILILTRFLSSPIANILNVFERQGLQLILNIVRVVLVLLVFTISNIIELTALNTIGVYSVLMTVYYAILAIIVLRVVKINIK
ncbi:MAG: oligosaccharide flippase family protein [Bacteroidales bacterium]|nr:oligosaccharide flippase family protein [Bacteroidales bacterium]